MSLYVDPVGIAAWVAEHADVTFAEAQAVLGVEFEYMVATGIAVGGPPDFTYRYYDPAELADALASVDTLRIARDAERLAGVAEAIGHRVLAAELAYLEMRGLV